MSTLIIPVGNTHRPHEVRFPTGRTGFQDKTVREIVASEEFDFACGSYELEGGSRYRGPFSFLWYSKDDKLHLTKIGQRRVLRVISP